MELFLLFDNYKKDIEQISARINAVQSSLDDTIFSIYQISQPVIDIIKQNIQIDL